MNRGDAAVTGFSGAKVWGKVPEGVSLAIKALSYPSDPIQAMAATALAEYGRPLGEPGRDALLAALKTAGKGAKPQIAWALVVLGDTRAFDDIIGSGKAKMLEFGVADETAWQVGLSCGGRIKVYVERLG